MIREMKYPKECTLCETQTKHVVDGKLKNTEEYNEVFLKLNNGSKMKVAVCNKHKDPKDEDYPKVMDKVRMGWAEEVAFGVGNEDWVKTIGKQLEIVDKED